MPQAASHPPLALIAHRQEWPARSLESILCPEGYTVLRTRSGQEVVEQAGRARPDLILLDAQLEDISALELCRILRSDACVGAGTPLVLTLAGRPTRQQRLEALRAGAWDLLALPLDAEELLLKLRTYVSAKREADLAREEGLLDRATGLYNLRGLLQRAREMAAAAFRQRAPLACVVFACPIPDTAAETAPSPPAPAATLEQLVPLFRRSARASDVLGRLGRTELVVLAPDTDAVGAMALARRLLDAADASGQAARGERGAAAEENGGAPPTLRAGCYAVANFHSAALEPVELLVRATLALRTFPPVGSQGRIRFFGQASPSLTG